MGLVAIIHKFPGRNNEGGLDSMDLEGINFISMLIATAASDLSRLTEHFVHLLFDRPIPFEVKITRLRIESCSCQSSYSTYQFSVVVLS